MNGGGGGGKCSSEKRKLFKAGITFNMKCQYNYQTLFS